jgi:phage N-6-adenine-methyltransferase
MMKQPTPENQRTDYETPWSLFNDLDQVFRFEVDLAAEAHNTKVPACYYTPEVDSLKQPWHNHKSCWLNPPFDRRVLTWVRKAHQESLLGATVVCLLQAHPGNKAFQEIIQPYARAICFMDKRIKFVGTKDVAAFDTAIVVFSPEPLERQQIEMLHKYGWVIVAGMTVRVEAVG